MRNLPSKKQKIAEKRKIIANFLFFALQKIRKGKLKNKKQGIIAKRNRRAKL